MTPCFWLTDAEGRFARHAAQARQAHALLLSGPRGLGKRDLALQQAAALLCIERARPACGRCRSCQLMASGAHPDFRSVTFELNDKGQLRKEIVVDQVRDLIASLQLTNSLSARKVALIEPAEALNRSAANALLKTLEEPAGEVVMLLVTSNEARLPATVRSRCQVIEVRQPEVRAAVGWLTERLDVDEATARLALEAGAGSPLLALRLVESGGLEGYRTVRSILGSVASDSGALNEAFAALSELEPVACWTWLSIASAEFVRGLLSRPDAERQRAAGRLRLQTLADRNRRLASTPVRHDLLLRDWLLQWAAPDA